METGGFKHSGNFWQIKYDKNYVSGNDGDNFQDEILKHILEK